MTERDWYTVEELAEKIGKSPATIRRWAANSQGMAEHIDFYKVGREYRFFREKMNVRFHIRED